jgi:hypothetical protein
MQYCCAMAICNANEIAYNYRVAIHDSEIVSMHVDAPPVGVYNVLPNLSERDQQSCRHQHSLTSYSSLCWHHQ